MQINDTIAINLATAYNAVSGNIISRGCMAEVVEVTEKAVKLQAATHNGKTMTAWFPKKALVLTKTSVSDGVFQHGNSQMYCVSLAKWFRAEGYTANFLNYAGAC
jgi:hypothetical protein